jgi:ABC-type Zn uptake system ZnuABC Zn-binding protein ZnuA
MKLQILRAVALAILTIACQSEAKVKVVSSTTDLASIAQMIGGDLISVESIAGGRTNVHFVEVLPSYMVKVSRADLYLKVGLGLDQWADQVIDGSRNGKLLIVDCSRDVAVLEKPTTKVTAAMGDVHPDGNPHYWLDPSNGLIIGLNILGGLTRVDPGHSQTYEANYSRFEADLKNHIAEWREKSKNLQGLEIVTYHNSWPYFAQAFGIDVVGFVEPRPGIEPTPSHTAALIDLVTSRRVKVIGKEPYFSDGAPNSIARQTGARVIELPPSVGSDTEVKTYFDLFEVLLGKLAESTG